VGLLISHILYPSLKGYFPTYVWSRSEKHFWLIFVQQFFRDSQQAKAKQSCYFCASHFMFSVVFPIKYPSYCERAVHSFSTGMSLKTLTISCKSHHDFLLQFQAMLYSFFRAILFAVLEGTWRKPSIPRREPRAAEREFEIARQQQRPPCRERSIPVEQRKPAEREQEGGARQPRAARPRGRDEDAGQCPAESSGWEIRGRREGWLGRGRAGRGRIVNFCSSNFQNFLCGTSLLASHRGSFWLHATFAWTFLYNCFSLHTAMPKWRLFEVQQIWFFFCLKFLALLKNNSVKDKKPLQR